MVRPARHALTRSMAARPATFNRRPPALGRRLAVRGSMTDRASRIRDTPASRHGRVFAKHAFDANRTVVAGQIAGVEP